MLDQVFFSPSVNSPFALDADDVFDRAAFMGAFDYRLSFPDLHTAVKSALLRINEDFFREIAEWYDRAPTVGTDADTVKTYAQLRIELENQLRLMRSFVEVETVHADRWFPYLGSAALFNDIHEKHHILRVVVKTEGDELFSPEQIATARVVHDFWGHGLFRLSFSPENEERALLVHEQMFSSEAQRAMKSLVRGQTAWTNFLPGNAELRFGKRPPAPWKSILLPDEYLVSLGDP